MAQAPVDAGKDAATPDAAKASETPAPAPPPADAAARGPQAELRNPDAPPPESALADPPAPQPPASEPTRARPDLKDVEALAGAMNKSAERLQTLWFTFLTVTVYFALSAGTTTHRMLFLEEGLKLPILDFKLPLLGFYFIAPAFYVAFHAYFLLMLVLLARTARTFERTLVAALPGRRNRQERERFRMRLENALFLQIIVGARRERAGWNGVWLRAIALLSLAVVPVLLLVFFQLMFLPYHSEPMTWWHRAMVVADLGVVWTLWPSYRREWGARLLPRWDGAGRMAVKGFFTALTLVFSLAMATFPDETIHENRVAWAVDGLSPKRHISDYLFGSTKFLFRGLAINQYGWFPNRLILPDEDFVDDEKLMRLVNDNRSGPQTRLVYSVSLVGRDLTGALLRGADLQRANFEGARIARANLSLAWLQDARFDVQDSENADLSVAQLQGAWLSGAQLEGAIFNDAALQGAILDDAVLHGASFVRAQMQGASLKRAHLQCANLTYARLNGSSLDEAQMQAALIEHAELRGASLARAKVWRVLGAQFDAAAADISELDHRQIYDGSQFVSKNSFDEWRQRLFARAHTSSFRVLDQEALDRILAITPRSIDLQAAFNDRFDMLEKRYWGDLSRSAGPHEKRRSLSRILEGIACDGTAAPRVAKRLLSGDEGKLDARLAAVGPEHLARIAERLRKGARAKPDEETDCPGARGLTEDDLQRLDELVARVKEDEAKQPGSRP